MAPRNDSFFKRLTSLFRSGPSIQRRVKGYDYKNYYDNELIRGNYGYRAPFPFGRESSPFSVLGAYGILDRMARYSEFAEMEYSLHPDTKIAVPGGYKTIKELADECEKSPEHTFMVYSYDHNEKRIIPAVGHQARKTCNDEAYEIIFDNGKKIIGSINHRLLKRDGTYCEIRDLKAGDAMMPFYRRSVSVDRTEGQHNHYQTIYTINREENKYGWTAEHKLLAEHILGRKLTDDEVVHHKNFLAHDNRIENLEVMTEIEHQRLHAEILNGRKWDYEKNGDWIEKFKQQHSAWMKENNPAERKDVTFEKILQWCDENTFNLYKVTKAFDTDYNTIKRKLQAKGYANFVIFAQAYCKNWRSDSWNNEGKNNPRFNNDITFQKICSLFSPEITQKELASKLGVSITPITNRLKENGYKSWSEFSSTYQNLKIVSIKPVGKMDLYDLTVDGYKNFATDTVISHNTPEIAAALNIFADESVAGDEKGKAFHLFTRNPEVKRALEELFYDILNIDFNLRPWVRNLVKYGDFFLYNEVVPDIGVVTVQPIPVNELEREEGFDQNDPYAVRFKWLTRGNRYLENWQVTHMRMLGNDLFLPYGTSLLEPARRTWRQLLMMEDAMLVYRVVRSPERRVFYIDVGNVAPNDVPAYMEAVKQTLRSNNVVDRTSGRVDQRYNPVAVDEDYFIPIRGSQTGTKIDTLAGGQNATATEDVEYLQRKLFAAIQVPKPYLNFDENLSAKASMAQMDIRFSRTIAVIQRIVVAELNKLAMIHLYTKGFDGEDLIDFELKLSNPSTIAIQQKLEVLSTKFDIAGKAKETMLCDEEWIQKQILDLSEDEIIKIEAGRRRDKIRAVEIEAVAVQDNLPQKQTMTDPFDKSNYSIPGQSVGRNPAQVDNTSPGFAPPATSVGGGKLVSTGQGPLNGEDTYKDTGSGLPITSTPFLTAKDRNERRKVGWAGKGATSMPDFRAMLDAKRNRSLVDIYDKDTINLKNPLSISESIDEMDFKAPPVLPSEMISIFSALGKRLEEMSRSRTSILSEAIDLENIEDGSTVINLSASDDGIILESVNEDDDDEDEKKDEVDLSSID